MKYNLGNLLNVTQSTEVLSDPFTIITSNDPETLSVDVGGITINGEIKGGIVQVKDGDVVRTRVTSPVGVGGVQYQQLTQNNDLVGVLSVTTTPESAFTEDPDYFGVPTYDVHSKDSWTPTNTPRVAIIDQTTYNLSYLSLEDKELTQFPSYRLHVLDYQRSKLFVIDPLNEEYKGSISFDAKPLKDIALYDSGSERKGYAIAFDDGTVRLYDSRYNEQSRITLSPNNQASLELIDQKLFITFRSSNVFEYDIQDITSPVSIRTHATGKVVNDIACINTTLYLVHDRSVEQWNSLTAQTIEELALGKPYATDISIDKATGAYFVTHSHLKYVTHWEGNSIQRSLHTGHIDYTQHVSDSIAFSCNFTDKHVVRHSPTSIGNVIQLNGAPQGITAFNNNLYVPVLYDNLPVRSVLKDIEPDIIDLGHALVPDSLGIVESNTVTIQDTSEPIKLVAPNLMHNVLLYKNGSLVDDVTTIDNGDTLQVKLDVISHFVWPMDIPIVYGPFVAIFKVSPDTATLLPADMVFSPILDAVPDSTRFSNSIEIGGLEHNQTVEVSSPDTVIRVNGTSVPSPASVKNGDHLQLIGRSAIEPGKEVQYTVTFADRFESAWYIHTVDPTNETEVYNVPSFIDQLEADLNATITSNKHVFNATAPVLISIPTVYNTTLHVNDIPKGQEALVNPGDTIHLTMETKNNYYTIHHIPISYNSIIEQWFVLTKPDYFTDPFDFGTHELHHIADYIESDIVTVTGISNTATVPLVVPYGFDVFINGQKMPSPEVVDYRDVPTHNTVQYIKNNNTVQLKGYPRPIYGEQHKIEVTIGYTKGYLRVGTFPSEGHITTQIDAIKQALHTAIPTRNNLSIPIDDSKEAQASASINAQEIHNHVQQTSVHTNAHTSIDTIVPTPSQSNAHTVVQPITAIYGKTQSYSHSLPITAEVSVSNGQVGTILENNTTVVRQGNNATSLGLHRGITTGYSNAIISHILPPKSPQYSQSNVPVEFTLDYTAIARSSNDPHTYTMNYQSIVTESNLVTYAAIGYTYTTTSSTGEYISQPFKAQADYAQASAELPGLEWVRYIVARGSDQYILPEFVYDSNRQPIYVPTLSKLAGLPTLVETGMNFLKSEFQVIAPNAEVVYNSVFQRNSVTPQVSLFAGWQYFEQGYVTYETGAIRYNDNEQVEILRSWTSFTNPETYFNPAYIRGTMLSYFQLDRIAQRVAYNTTEVELKGSVIDPIPLVTVDGRQADFNRANPIEFQAMGYITSTNSHIVEVDFDSVFDMGSITDAPPLGYFATEQEAINNATLNGMADGTFYVAQIAQGYVWIRIMPCVNLCYDECPPAGYIQGG